MNRAKFLGTVPLDLIRLPESVGNWEAYETEDIFATNFINYPHDYMFTMGSGIDMSYGSTFASLATIPNYDLLGSEKFYVAGRDIVRWGGVNDPDEIDFDRYIFVPDNSISLAKVYRAPKSEPHHLSELPDFIKTVPESWKEFCEAIRNGEFGNK